MKGENQPHKNVGAMPPCSPEKARDKEKYRSQKKRPQMTRIARMGGQDYLFAHIFGLHERVK